MILFVLTFLCLYGGINFYAFFRARSVFHFSGFPQTIIIIVLILLYDLNIVGKVLTYNTKIRQNIYTWML